MSTSKMVIFCILLILINVLHSENCEIEIGQIAPDFALKNQNGKIESLSKYKGHKVAIYFYPKNNTRGCTKEACNIRDNFEILNQKKIKVFGISYDNQKKHKDFIKEYNLQFDLLSDSDKTVSKLYCADGWFLPKRITYLVDEGGYFYKIIKDIDVDNHAQQILEGFFSSKH
ncbi:MAG: peroxiredoxin [Candidatus Marinimicrobia bacterium]|nr:peroxiredoxin [Candidatus Neomarinimicrobiota bacterium]|tara:strand:+ start:328 stop:843 length:516 start_codon:yes stop_codon:yes gene_type:complete